MWAAVFYGGSKRRVAGQVLVPRSGGAAPGAWLRHELVRGDLLQPASLDSAFSGVDTAFYLVHSMNSGAGFEANEAASAANFAHGNKAGVAPHHLSGALASGEHLSPHMRSRLETGNILRSGAIPALEFQASVIIGSGSASFELIRAPASGCPLMITPRWVNTAAQPIGIEDVIEYLIAGIRVPLESVTVQIGGSDVTSYVGLMREFARQRNLPLVYTRSVPEPILIQPLADADHTGVCIHRPPPD